jgi:hypothetical protein
MAGLINTYLEDVLDFYWGSVDPISPTPPDPWYVGLFTAVPNDAGVGGTEAAWTGYARQSVANTPTEWPAASSGSKHNANTIDFGVAASGPTNVVAVGFWDDPTGTGAAHLWYWNLLTGQPITVANGGDASFATGTIIIDRC